MLSLRRSVRLADMVKFRRFDMKWRLLGYFAAASFVTMAALYIALEHYAHELEYMKYRYGFMALVLVAGLAIGFVAAKRWQRKTDTLYLAILELSKGNYANR